MALLSDRESSGPNASCAAAGTEWVQQGPTTAVWGDVDGAGSWSQRRVDIFQIHQERREQDLLMGSCMSGMETEIKQESQVSEPPC